MAFPCLAIFLAFIVFLAIRYRSIDQAQKQVQEDFWERELKANSTIGIDINTLDYLHLPIERFPFGKCSTPEIEAIESELRELSEKPLLNLTGITNTELKLTYGVPNFDKMSAIGEDFDRATILLNDYSRLLIENEMPSEAIPVLEYAVGVKTDISSSYTMLSDLYAAANSFEKLSRLRDMVENTTLILKPSILAHIDELLSQNTVEDVVTEEIPEDNT